MLKRTKSPLVLAVLLLGICFVVMVGLSPTLAGEETAAATTVVLAEAPMSGGSSEASVLPAPVAMFLGIVGLSIIGFRMRKYA